MSAFSKLNLFEMNFKSIIYLPLFILLLVGCMNNGFRKLEKQKIFKCDGILKTMLHELPLHVKWDGSKLYLTTDTKSSLHPDVTEVFDDLKIPIPEINGSYEPGVQYSDGVKVVRVDKNKFSVSHYHVDGTLFLDECRLEYPLEIDSTKKIIEFSWFLNFLD